MSLVGEEFPEEVRAVTAGRFFARQFGSHENVPVSIFSVVVVSC